MENIDEEPIKEQLSFRPWMTDENGVTGTGCYWARGEQGTPGNSEAITCNNGNLEKKGEPRIRALITTKEEI